jgi:hypothetical protein
MRMNHQIITAVRWAVIVVAVVALVACQGNRRVSTGVSIHGSSSGSWGHSISVGIHSHGRRW